jgi:plasmid stabilization system protein ParE
MTVRYTATALAEIEEICSYVAKDNERAAASVAAAIERRSRQLRCARDRRRWFTRDGFGRSSSEGISIVFFTK